MLLFSLSLSIDISYPNPQINIKCALATQKCNYTIQTIL